MKTLRIFSLIISMTVLGSLLAGCMGGGASATVYNWPGLTIDQQSGRAYLSNAQSVQAIDLNDLRDVLDEKTGAVISQSPTRIWTFPTEVEKSMAFTAPVAMMDDGQLIAGGYNESVYSIDPENGSQNWVNADASNRYYGEALTLNNVIFAPNIDHNLYAIDAKGRLLWKFEAADALWSKPATDGQLIYLGGMDHIVYALDPKTGNVIWQTDDLGAALVANPLLGVNGELYIGTLGSEMLALDTKAKGKILWRLPVAGWVYSAPALDNDRLYFGDLDGAFYCVDAANGKIVWQVQPDPDATKDRAIVTTPLVLDGNIYLGNRAGHVFAYDSTKDRPDLQWDTQLVGKLYAPVQAFGDTIIFTLTGTGPILVGLDQSGKQVWAYSIGKR